MKDVIVTFLIYRKTLLKLKMYVYNLAVQTNFGTSPIKVTLIITVTL